MKFVSSLGFGVCGIVLLFFLAGWLLDRYFLTGATGIAVCVLAGGVLSVLWAWKRVSLMMEKLYRQMREDSSEQSLSADEPLNDNK